MKQIVNVPLLKLHTDEVLGLLLQVAAKTSLVSVESDQEVINAFKAATTGFNEVMRPSTVNSFTAARKAADEVTDYLCIGIRMYAEAMTYSPDAAAQAIAVKVFASIKKYGYLTQMGYKEQYPNLQALLQELRAMPASDLDTIGLSVWVTALEDAYDTFVSITSEKVEEDVQKQVGVVQDSRIVAQDAYDAMVRRINAGAAYMGDAPYVAFIDTINVIVGEYKTLLASRKTRAENAKEKSLSV